MKKVFRYRIYPNHEQQVLFSKTFGCKRFIWNSLLASNIEHMKKFNEELVTIKPRVGQNDLVKSIIDIKMQNEWIYEVSATAMQQVAIDLSQAFKHFFRRGGFPQFKSKRDKQSFRLMKDAFDIRDGELKICKSNELIKINFHRELPSAPSSVTIIKEPDGKYYASFVCEYDPILTNGQGSVGIDLGIKDFATLSTGEKIANPKFLEKAEKKLKKLQRRLAKKQKSSNNRNKTRLKVAKQHSKIKHQRNDFLHKLTRKLVNENQVIAIESLNIKGMIKNRHLAKSISSVGWRLFTEMLSHKAYESQWCTILRIDPWFASTQTCSHCSYRNMCEDKLKLSVRQWVCPQCHTTHDRDSNAAQNILNKGLECFDNLIELHRGSTITGNVSVM